MSSKRSRVVRSSSMGEVGLLDPIESPIAIWEKKRATIAQVNAGKLVQKPVIKNLNVSVAPPEEPRNSIMTFGSKYEGSEAKVDERFGAFFQACALCKKKIARDMDVYMYGYLQAFCSPVCRNTQIALDDKFRTPPQPIAAVSAKSPVAKAAESSEKSGFVTQAQRPVVARFK